VQQVRQDGFGELKRVAICAQQQSVDERVVGLPKEMGTSAAVRESGLRELVKFLRSVSALLMKFVMFTVPSLPLPSMPLKIS